MAWAVADTVGEFAKFAKLTNAYAPVANRQKQKQRREERQAEHEKFVSDLRISSGEKVLLGWFVDWALNRNWSREMPGVDGVERACEVYFPRKNKHVILGFVYCIIEGIG